MGRGCTSNPNLTLCTLSLYPSSSSIGQTNKQKVKLIAIQFMEYTHLLLKRIIYLFIFSYYTYPIIKGIKDICDIFSITIMDVVVD